MKEKQQPVLVYPHPGLNIICDDVEMEDLEEVKALADQLIITMYRNKAAGLSAPQIGHTKRIICILLSDDTPEIIVNPVIADHEEETISMVEGCLSLPNVRALIKHRYKAVLVEGFDAHGEPTKREYWDREAVAVQHECDHLNGITLMEHIRGVKRMIAKKKLKKIREAIRKSPAYAKGLSAFVLE